MTWTITYSITDEKGETSQMRVYLPQQDITTIVSTADDPIEYAQALATYIDAMITGVIVNISLTANVTLPGGLNTVPGSSSDVEEGALFTFITTNGYRTSMRVPTFDEANVIVGTTRVDQTATAVANFLEAVLTPADLVENWGIAPSDSRGDDIATLRNAVEKFRA